MRKQNRPTIYRNVSSGIFLKKNKAKLSFTSIKAKGDQVMNELIEYNMSDDLQKDLYGIIENAQQTAIVSVNSVFVIHNWLIGMRISREKMGGTRSERYGEGIISELADELTQKYGKGFDKRSLYRYVQFYQSYPEIVGMTTPQSGEHAMIAKGRRILTWSHYERLLQVSDTTARAWYEKEAIEQSWSVKTLRRNISIQYYDRMLLSTDKDSIFIRHFL